MITKEIQEAINSIYGQSSDTYGVYRSKKTGAYLVTDIKPCRCSWELLKDNLTREEANKLYATYQASGI